MIVIIDNADFVMRKNPAFGFIAGEFPGGIVTLDNVPGRAVVDVLQRSDHAWLRRAVSASDGTYRFDGLPLGTEFDLIGRDITDTWGDVIVSRVQPYAPPQVTTPALTFTAGVAATTQMESQYGTGPMVWSIDTLPAGLSLSSSGLWSGTPTAGSTAVVITVEDVYGETGSKAFNVVVA